MPGLNDIDWSKYGVSPPPSLDENGLDKNSKYYEERKSAQGQGSVLDQLRKEDQVKLDKAKQDNNYWDILTTPRDRVLADKNQDGKVDYAEYREFTLAGTKQQVQQKSTLITPLTLSIGMVCITLILIAILFTRKRSKP
jgi:hypothetical protein